VEKLCDLTRNNLFLLVRRWARGSHEQRTSEVTRQWRMVSGGNYNSPIDGREIIDLKANTSSPP
jgi:hypothetical protein